MQSQRVQVLYAFLVACLPRKPWDNPKTEEVLASVRWPDQPSHVTGASALCSVIAESARIQEGDEMDESAIQHPMNYRA